jgi:NAD(P)-dependent dehydrogenase (short-subunit alcohol dehydrogenase family)
MDLGLQGKTVLITGGGTGLGRATAEAFAREGVRVAICGRNLEILEKAASNIENETGGEVFAVAADVTNTEDLERLVAAVVDRFGAIDILVNNADFGPELNNFLEVTDKIWLDRIDVKLMAAVRLSRLVIPGMMERRWGRILTMTGMLSHSGSFGYEKGATQGGLINLTKKLASEFGQYGITANAVDPGNMWTDGTTVEGESRAVRRRRGLEEAAQLEGVTYDEMLQRHLSTLNIGRQVQPEDAAGVLVFLASDRAATITGESVVADGGQRPFVRY